MTGLIATLFFLLASGFYSGTEMGLYRVNRIRLRLRSHLDHGSARILQNLVLNREDTVLAILLGTNLANYLLTVACSLWLTKQFSLSGDQVAYYTAAILSPMVFVFGDVVPKNWFQADANRLMYRSAHVLNWTLAAARWTGLLWLLRTMTQFGARLAMDDETDEPLHGARGEVLGLMREGAAVGALSEDQSRFVQNIMTLSSVRVGGIMVPYPRVTTVPIDASRAAFEQIVETHKFSRLPVIGKDRRQVVGIINVIDPLYNTSPDATIGKLMQPVLMVPAKESASTALVRLRQAKTTIAMVTDPRRGIVGLITLKDVVEEIFGELPEW